MTTEETSHKRAIKDYLRMKGFFVYHNLAGLGQTKGIPDITAIKNGKVWQIEVKVGKKSKQSDNQKKFQKEWEKNGGNYLVGDIDEVMKKIK